MEDDENYEDDVQYLDEVDDEPVDDSDGESGDNEAGAGSSDATPADSGAEDEAGSAGRGRNPNMVPAKALSNMRKRSQEAEERNARLEREIANLRGQFEQYTRQAQPQARQEPEEQFPEIDYTNLDGTFRQYGEHVTKRAITALERKQQERQQQKEAEWRDTLGASIATSRELYDDYDQVASAFDARLRNDPKLQKLFRRQADPAEWGYQNQKRFEARRKSSETEAERLRKRIAELEGQRGKKPPRSIANARGGGPSSRGSTGSPNRKEAFNSLFSKRKGA